MLGEADHNGGKVLRLLGLSFRDAPLAVREAVAFDDTEVDRALRAIRSEVPGVEALLLATCNRTELYLVGPAGREVMDAVHACVRSVRPEAPVSHQTCWRHTEAGPDAFRHLVRVAAGLDSAVLGDREVQGQLRRATGVAAAAGTLGPWLRQATTAALRVGKVVRSRTALSAGGAGVGSAVTGVLRQSAPDGAEVLLLGAGDVAHVVARSASKAGYRLAVANRTRARAEDLAERCGGRVVAWEDRAEAFVHSDVVVAATAGGLALDAATLEAGVAERGRALVVDLGVPRSVATTDVQPVMTVDLLREHTTSLLEARQSAVPAAEAVVEAEVAAWLRWTRGRPAEEAIRRLHLDVGPLVDGCEPVVRSVLRRVLHEHATELRASC